ncbi:SARNP protein, partial [Leptocoma aspasia]|nr:SARNP protein [Leptocoma aspasia]
QLAELKQECLARGLEAKGNKQDLIHRLQAYLEEHAEEEPNEEDVLGEEIEGLGYSQNSIGIPRIPAVIPKILAPMPKIPLEFPKSHLRFPKFRPQFLKFHWNSQNPGPNSHFFHSHRFGLATIPTKDPKSQISSCQINLEKLKERAQRFGLNVSSLSRKSEEDEKLKKRKERFGIVTGAGAAEDSE